MKVSVLKSFFAVLLVTMFGSGKQAAVAAPAQHALGGSVVGLATGNTIALRNVSGTEVLVTRNGSFTFGSISAGAPYNVTVKTHPSYPAGNCIVTDGAGTAADVDIKIAVSCAQLPKVTSLRADVSVFHARTISTLWDGPAAVPAATDFNLYVSTRRDCDFSRDTYAGCPGEKVQGAFTGTPITLFRGQQLKNGQDYFLQVETVFANGAKGLSNLVRAQPNEVAFDSTVRTITAAPNGTVYLGGDFTGVGVATGSAVLLDSSTGTPATLSTPAIAGTVRAIVGDGAGGWYLGGQFTQVGNLPQRNLTHIRADGSVDSLWRMFPDGPVHALELLGGVLYVGGSFNTISGVTRRNAAALVDAFHGEGVFPWNPSPNNTVRALEVCGSSLYMGGDFTADSGKPAFFAAFSLKNDQQPFSDQPLPFDLYLNGAVRALATYGTDTLYVGGAFTKVGDAKRFHVAKLLVVSQLPFLQPFNPDPGVSDNASSSVGALAVDRFGMVYIGGTFATIRSENRTVAIKNLAMVFPQGAVSTWKPNPDYGVEALAVESDGSAVYVGGAFTRIGPGTITTQTARNKLAKVLTTNAEAVTVFQTDPGATVRALALSGDTLFAGGDFTFINRLKRNQLAAIDGDGSLLPWSPGAAGEINTLVYHNNRFRGPVVYVGGSFNLIGGKWSPNLAALNALDGTVLANSGFVGTTDGEVYALAVLESSEALYVGGAFSTVADSPAYELAKLFLFNGTVNLDFNPEPMGPINALIATKDAVSGKDVVYAGGNFSDIRRHDTTPSRVNLAKIDANSGIALDEFVVNPNGPVLTLALSSDPYSIYVGGQFDRINGNLIGTPGVSGIVAVEIDGSPLLTGCSTCFNPGPDGGMPLALATIPRGFGERVFAGGSFPNIGGGPISNFAALTGYSYGAPTGFSSGSFVFPNGTVSALAVSGNKVYVGGKFTGFYGSVNGSVAGAARGNFGVVDATTGELIH